MKKLEVLPKLVGVSIETTMVVLTGTTPTFQAGYEIPAGWIVHRRGREARRSHGG